MVRLRFWREPPKTWLVKSGKHDQKMGVFLEDLNRTVTVIPLKPTKQTTKQTRKPNNQPALECDLGMKAMHQADESEDLGAIHVCLIFLFYMICCFVMFCISIVIQCFCLFPILSIRFVCFIGSPVLLIGAMMFLCWWLLGVWGVLPAKALNMPWTNKAVMKKNEPKHAEAESLRC